MAIFLLSCAASVDVPGYPLYPGASRLPRERVAKLFGPIGSVDAHDVSNLGGAFELLPGCHIVRTSNDAVESTTYVAVFGRTGRRLFAFVMKPGYSYIVKRVIASENPPYLRDDTFAEELDPSGSEAQIIYPTHAGEHAACLPGP